MPTTAKVIGVDKVRLVSFGKIRTTGLSFKFQRQVFAGFVRFAIHASKPLVASFHPAQSGKITVSNLVLLFVVWLVPTAFVVFALVFGKIPAHGSKGGGPGFGHLCDRREDPTSFWVCVSLFAFLSIYFMLGSDVFSLLPGTSVLVGRDIPIQDVP